MTIYSVTFDVLNTEHNLTLKPKYKVAPIVSGNIYICQDCGILITDRGNHVEWTSESDLFWHSSGFPTCAEFLMKEALE